MWNFYSQSETVTKSAKFLLTLYKSLQ